MASIYTRKSGSRVVYCVQYRVAGKRYSRVVGTSRDAAEGVLREVNRLLAARDPVLDAKERQRARTSIEDYWARDYLPWSRAHKAAGGHARDKTIVGKLSEYLVGCGCVWLQDVTPMHLERYKVLLRDRGTPENANRHLHTIRHAFSLAVHLGHLRESPMARVKELPPAPGRPPRYFSEAEMRSILWAALLWDEGFYRCILFLVSTGARISELASISWEHVHLGRGFVRLPTRKKRAQIVWRTVPIAETLSWVLGRAKRQGEPIAELSEARRRLQRILRLIEIPHANIHTLRHTFASHLVSRGVSLYVVGQLLGHSNPQTTQIYSHLLPSSLEVVSLLPW